MFPTYADSLTRRHRAYGEAHTGAMVALVPTPADAARLALTAPGAEPADELHLTLWFLGAAADISTSVQRGLVQSIRSMVERRRLIPVEARAFGAALWNPDGAQPAWVLNVGELPADERPDGQEGLGSFRQMMDEAWHDGGVDYTPPEQHKPWAPHVCLAYSDDPELAAVVADRTGPITFDRVRVAFAGRHVDIPLGARARLRKFDPRQARDDFGRWTQDYRSPDFMSRGITVTAEVPMEVAERLANHTATAEDIQSIVSTDEVGSFWYKHDERHSFEDAEDFAWHEENVRTAIDDKLWAAGEYGDDATKLTVGMGVVLVAKTPEGWDPEDQAAPDLMGNSYIPEGPVQIVAARYYTGDNAPWTEIKLDAVGHNSNGDPYGMMRSARRLGGHDGWKKQPRDPDGKDAGQWVEVKGGPASITKSVDAVKGALSKMYGAVDASVDRKGVHFTVTVKQIPVTITLTPLDLAGFALGFLGGGLGAVAKSASLANKVSKAHKIAKAAQAAKVAAGLIGVASTVNAKQGQKAKALEAAERNWEDQPREDNGQWTTGGGSVVGGLRDALKLAGRVKLDLGEELVGSAKFASDSGIVRVAATRINGRPAVRLGVGDDLFGTRDDEGGPWRGGNDLAAINAERAALRDEFDALDEIDEADWTPEQRARYGALDDMETSELIPNGYTTRLDAAAVERLRREMRSGIAKASAVKAEDDAKWAMVEQAKAEAETLVQRREPLRIKYVAAVGREEYGDKPVPGAPPLTPAEDAELDRLTTQWLAAADRHDTLLAEYEGTGSDYYDRSGTSGVVPGEWADLHFETYFDEPEAGVRVRLAAVPHGTDPETVDDVQAYLEVPDALKLLDMLGTVVGGARSGRRGLRRSGTHHSNYQLRDPHTGEWIDDGTVLTDDRLASIFGAAVADEAANDGYHVQAHAGGRVVLLRGDADGFTVPRHFAPGEAEALSRKITEAVEMADAHDLADEDDPDPDMYSGETTRLPDGSYVDYDPRRERPIRVMLGGDDGHDFDRDDAETLADALSNMAYDARGAADRAADVPEDEPDEVDEPDEPDEVDEPDEPDEVDEDGADPDGVWWDDIDERVGANRLTMSSATEVEVANLSAGWVATEVAVDDVPTLADAIRKLAHQSSNLPDWEPEDDDEADDPPSIERVDISDQLSLNLLADGALSLAPAEGFEVPLPRTTASDLADALDRLLARIQATPQRGRRVGLVRGGDDHWEGQPRHPGGKGGGQWVPTGRVFGYDGTEGWSPDGLRRNYGPVMEDVEFTDGLYVTRHPLDVITVSSDLSDGPTTGSALVGREVATDALTPDSAHELADLIESARGELADDETGEGRPVEWLQTDVAGIAVGADFAEEVVTIGWPKTDEPDVERLDTDFDVWQLTADDAENLENALREMADVEAVEVDAVSVSPTHDAILWSDHDIGFSPDGGETVDLAVSHRVTREMFEALDELRASGAGVEGAPDISKRVGWGGTYTLTSESDGSVSITASVGPDAEDQAVTIPPGKLSDLIDAFDDLLSQVDGDFVNEESYDPPLPSTPVEAMARRIFRDLIRRSGIGDDHWLDQPRFPKGTLGGLGGQWMGDLTASAPFGRRHVVVRPEYKALKTVAEVEERLQIDLRRVLRQKGGTKVTVDLGTKTSLLTAKEYAEGLVRMAERWPEARLASVRVGKLEGGRFGEIKLLDPGSRRVGITFDVDASSAAGRKKHLAKLRAAEKRGRPGGDFAYVATSLLGAAVDAMVGSGPARDHAGKGLDQYLDAMKLTDASPTEIQKHVQAQLGDVALRSRRDMVSEALADDALNGQGASPLSIAIRSNVTESYVAMLTPPRHTDIKHPEAKVPPGPLFSRPDPPFLRPPSGRVLTPMQRAAEMMASGQYSEETIMAALRQGHLVPPKPPKPAPPFNSRAAKSFVRSLVMAGDLTQLVWTGDQDRVRAFVKRQNSTALHGLARVYGIRVTQGVTHSKLVEKIIDAATKAEAKAPEMVKRSDGPDMSWLHEAYAAWLVADAEDGVLDLADDDLDGELAALMADDDYTVPGTAARSLLVTAFGGLA